MCSTAQPPLPLITIDLRRQRQQPAWPALYLCSDKQETWASQAVSLMLRLVSGFAPTCQQHVLVFLMLCSMWNASDAFPVAHMHVCIHLPSGVPGGALVDVVCLFQATSGSSGFQAQPHLQSSRPPMYFQRPTSTKAMLDEYLRDMKRRDDLVREKPYLRSGRQHVLPPTLPPQQAEGTSRAPHQEAEPSLSEADPAHSSAQLFKVQLLFI